ncbi:unnamed protein product [Trifolium pratense]|uniref:Uncharacterized protein n=1 Tax=Trifolium pratense TaxID=57577 RepID=A0ACB0JMC8_TRIPR|nr:unnamed protein product [Trifolium pratense]
MNFSRSRFKISKLLLKKRPTFSGVENLDDNTKVSALKASSFVVSLVSSSGASVLSQNCGAIVERDGNTNIVITSLNLARPCDETKFRKNDLADDLKVVVYASDGSCFFEPAKLSMINDASVSETDFLRRHSNKSKHGDNVIVVGRYFQGVNEYMAAPGVLSLNRFRSEKYDCNELFTISSRFTRCDDGASVISTSRELLGITFFDISTSSPLLPINLINKMWEHFKEHGKMRHPSYGFDAKNVRFALLPKLES